MSSNKILVDIAREYLNVRESSVNNIGPQIQQFQKATWLAPGPWAWCAAFMCHVLKKALENPKYVEYIESRYTIVGKLEDWRCKDASAFGWITWAKKIQQHAKHKDMILFDERYTSKAGDIVVFDFSHIGINEIDQVPNSGIIHPIEGNTSPKTQQRDGAYDGVHQMTRKDNLVRSYIRI